MNADHESRIVRLRKRMVGVFVLVLSIDLFGRYLSSLGVPKLVTELLGLGALAILAASALYLIFSLQKLLLLKRLMGLAAFLLLFSQVLNILDSIPAFDAWPPLGGSGPLHEQLKNYTLLLGLIVMLATLYLSLLEMVAIQDRLMRERAELSQEIAIRKSTEAALNESNEQVRRLSAHLASAREEERANIAREIHDELGQALTSLRIDLAGLEQRVGKLSPEDTAAPISQQIRSMTALIAETMQSVRKIITELRPGILDDLGLSAAIEWQASEFEKRVGLPCTVIIESDSVPIGRDKTIALFRILQEALTNVARHAEARSVTVKLTADGPSVTLEVADDGKGIADPRAAERSSFGLLGIRERLLQFHGECVIHSAVGQGSRIVVTLPSDAATNV